MDAKRVSTHPILAEIDRAERRDLQCEVLYKCDQCHRRGTSFWGTSWLCAFCWLKAENELRREVER